MQEAKASDRPVWHKEAIVAKILGGREKESSPDPKCRGQICAGPASELKKTSSRK